jgi:peptide/nickel transport system substrate-binding protein
MRKIGYRQIAVALGALALLAAFACTQEIIKEVPVDRVVTQEVVKEVPVETIVEVEKETVRTVEVEKPVEVVREVVKEVQVPGDTVVVEVEKEVVREVTVEVPVEIVKTEIKEVQVEKTVIQTVTVEIPPSPLADKQDLRIAQTNNPVGLRASETTLQSESVIQLLHDPYFLFDDATSNFVGKLATEWSFVDPLTFELKIQDNVYFHNGVQFTAPLAVADLEWQRNESGEDGLKNKNFAGFETWEAVDDYTLRLGRSAPHSNPLASFTRGRYKTHEPGRLAETGWGGYSDNPAGTGPMQYVDWERENFVRMERFPDYWDFNTQIATISFHQVGEPAVRIAGLRTNEFNIVYSLPPDLIPSLLRDNINVFTGTVQQTETMYLNPRATEPQMDDKRVRQAMQYAIDLDAIHRTILGGYALPVPAGQMTPVGQFGYNPDVQAYPHDPDKARALLAEAGYADGINVSGVSSIGRYFRNQEVLTAMIAQWKEVGINADLDFRTSSQWLAALRAGELGAISDIGMNWYGLYPILITRVNHPDWQDRAARINGETDRATLEELLLEAAAYMHDQAWSIFAYRIPLVFGLHPDIAGLTWGPSWELRLQDAKILASR